MADQRAAAESPAVALARQRSAERRAREAKVKSEFDGSQATPILHPDYSDRGPPWALQALRWIDEGRMGCLEALSVGFTHEVQVRPSEDDEPKWFPCRPLYYGPDALAPPKEEQEMADEVVMSFWLLAFNGEEGVILEAFPRQFIRKAAKPVPSPASQADGTSKLINRGVDGMPISASFGGLDPYWCGVYLAKVVRRCWCCGVRVPLGGSADARTCGSCLAPDPELRPGRRVSTRRVTAC